MARIPLVGPEALADELASPSDSMDLPRLNIIRAMGNNIGATRAASEYVRSLFALLPADVREIAILATAREKGSTYEWHQHVGIGLDEGVPLGTVRAIGGEEHDRLDDADRAVVAFVRAQVRGSVTDAEFDALAAHFPPEDIVAISRVAANYAGTAEFIAAMGIELEEPFVGWVPEG